MRQFSDNNSNNRIAQALTGRKLLIVSIFFFVVVAGMLTTFLITPKYEATMSILVSRDRIDPQITSSDKNSEITQTAISDEEFNSELELVKSIDVITGVVKELDLINDRKPKEDNWIGKLRGRVKASVYEIIKTGGEKAVSDNQPSTQQDFSLETAVNRVEANLEVVPTKKSRIIKVTYVDTDPLRAKRTLEHIYQKYVDLHVRMNDKPEAEQVFKDQSDKFNHKLNATTNELKQFDVRNGVTGTEIGTQRELLLKQLYDTQAQTSSTQTEIGETEQRAISLKAKIESMPEQIQTSSVSKYVGALDGMKGELIKLEQERTNLMQKYKPGSRFVRENEERIEKLKKGIANETANPPQERSFALNDLRRKLEGDLNLAQTSLAGLRKREATLTAQASKLSGQVVSLNGKSIERDDLTRRRSINEEAYMLYQKKARENEISQVLNKEQVMNFGVVDPPRTDGEQKNPKPLLNLLVLMAVGAVAGLASALVLSNGTERGFDDDLLLSAPEIERRLGLPVLATIPVIADTRTELLRLNP